MFTPPMFKTNQTDLMLLGWTLSKGYRFNWPVESFQICLLKHQAGGCMSAFDFFCLRLSEF